MAKLDIVIHPYDSLRATAEEVTTSDLMSVETQQFIDDLMETLEDKFPLGAGLSANQVDVLKRIFVINLELDNGMLIKQVFVNPKIELSSDETGIDWEGCLSFPDQWGQVVRPKTVRISAWDRHGDDFEINASNFYARLLQHELDHLNGDLFIDKLESELIDTKELDTIVEKADRNEPSRG